MPRRMPQQNLRKLLEALAAREIGPQPTFQKFEFLDLFLILDKEGLIGRKRLSERLGIGEGAVRTMLQRLKAESLIEVMGRGGCRLSEKGAKLVNLLKMVLRDVGPVNLKLPWNYPSNYVVIVRNAAESVKKGLEQRDEAIRAGARALMVLTYVNGRLMMPGVADLTSEKPDFASSLVNLLKPEEGDVILISAGDSVREARRGALAAAQTLF